MKTVALMMKNHTDTALTAGTLNASDMENPPGIFQETRAYWEHRLFPHAQARESALPVDDTSPREIAAVDNRLIWLKEGDLK